MPMIEGDLVQCIRALLAHLTPEELARVRAELAPRRGSMGHALQVAQLEAKREELGLAPLKLFDPEAEADEPLIVEDECEFHDGKPLAPIFAVPRENEPRFAHGGELWSLDSPITLADDDQDGDEDDTIVWQEADKNAKGAYLALAGQDDAE